MTKVNLHFVNMVKLLLLMANSFSKLLFPLNGVNFLSHNVIEIYLYVSNLFFVKVTQLSFAEVVLEPKVCGVEAGT